MQKIIVQNLSKSFPINGSKEVYLNVIDDVSLVVEPGEFVTFFGPNGCGKSTLVNILAGILDFDTGSISIDSKTPKEAKTGLVFQNFSDSLMPWLTCKQNILFPYSLKSRKREFFLAEKRLMELLDKLEIKLPLNHFIYQLSGGQRNLVAILRTLIYKPDVILFDEPFSALDYENRIRLQNSLLKLWQEEKTTILFISHDIEEAIFLANRLVILSHLPARVKKIIDIDFNYPRDHSLYETEEFFALKKNCLEIFKTNEA
jgi:NitT/TauT family transport system ATP-binding protein